MNDCETFDDSKQRAIKNVKNTSDTQANNDIKFVTYSSYYKTSDNKHKKKQQSTKENTTDNRIKFVDIDWVDWMGGMNGSLEESSSDGINVCHHYPCTNVLLHNSYLIVLFASVLSLLIYFCIYFVAIDFKKPGSAEKKDNERKNDLTGNKQQVPVFIRLFQIRRIINKFMNQEYDKNSKNNDINLTNMVKDTISTIDITIPKIESKVTDILSSLVSDGIEYMNNHKHMNDRNNKEHAEYIEILEIIFREIILKKFETEYEKLIRYTIGDNSNYFHYQNMVFNSNDLIWTILKYFDIPEFISFGLVNTKGLYHTCKVTMNSVYHVDLNSLIGHYVNRCIRWAIDPEDEQWRDEARNRADQKWKQLVNVRSVYIELGDNYNSSVLEKIAMLRRVTRLKIVHLSNPALEVKFAPPSKESESREMQRIRYYVDPRDNQLTPLTLVKTIWYNKCKSLSLKGFNLNKKMCQFMIKHCDCSNVKNLELDNITLFSLSDRDIYDYSIFGDTKTIKKDVSFDLVDESIIKKLASKFINIERLKISIDNPVDESKFLFWQMLKDTIFKKKKVKAELNICKLRKETDYTLLDQIMTKKELKVNKLIVSGLNKIVHKFVLKRDDVGELKHLKIYESKGLKFNLSDNIKGDKKNRKLVFKSINVLEIEALGNDKQPSNKYVQSILFDITLDDRERYDPYYDNSLGDYIDQLSNFLALIVEKQLQLFVMVNMQSRLLYYHDTNNATDAILIPFKALCQNIYNLIVNQIPFSIKMSIIIAGVSNGRYAPKRDIPDDVFKQFLSIYLSFFKDEKFVARKYRSKHHDLCVPRIKPYSSFVCKKRNVFVLMVTNVHAQHSLNNGFCFF